MGTFFINLDLQTPERYDFSKFLNYSNNDNHDILTSFFLLELKKLSQSGTYVIESEEERPDLASFKIYGNTQYWWLLMEYNDLISYTGFKSGIVLKYPSIEDIEDLYFRLKSLETSQT